jgi:small-conductance mechanosensitive channel
MAVRTARERAAELRTNEARPHFKRAALLTVLAVLGLGVASALGLQSELANPWVASKTGQRAATVVGTLIFVFAAIAAVRRTARGVRELTGSIDDAKSGPLAVATSIIGYLLVIIGALGSLNGLAALRPLLVGGAVTGVLLGIAAQQTLSNFFAGLVLLIVRPFRVGEQVVVRSGALGGEYEGTVVEMGLFYVSMTTDRGHLELPNAQVLAAAVGPGARSLEPGQKIEEDQEDEDTARSGGAR